MKTKIRVCQLESRLGDYEVELNAVLAALKEPNTARSHLSNQVRLVSVYAIKQDVFAVFEVTEPTLR